MAKKKKAKKVAKKATKKTAKKVAKKAGKKVAKKAAKKATKKVAKKAAKKTAKKVAKKATKKAAKKVAKKVTKKATKAAAKKVTKKVAKKAPAKKSPKIETKSASKEVTKKQTKKAAPEKEEVKKKKDAATSKVTKPAVKETKKKEAAPAKTKTTSSVKKIQIQKDVVLTDAEGRILCRVRDCDQPAVVENYCRYHYLLYWKKIQIRKKILSEGKLEKYIEELTSRYPNKYLELIKRDLSTEADFLHAIQELEIDESAGEEENRDYDEERSFIEEVRGVSDSDREESEY